MVIKKSFILIQEVFYLLISGLACIGFADLRYRQLPGPVLLQVSHRQIKWNSNLHFNFKEITVSLLMTQQTKRSPWKNFWPCHSAGWSRESSRMKFNYHYEQNLCHSAFRSYPQNYMLFLMPSWGGLFICLLDDMLRCQALYPANQLWDRSQ